jgi:hypothetical protein
VRWPANDCVELQVEDLEACGRGKKVRNANCQKTRSTGGQFGELIDRQVAGNAKRSEILMRDVFLPWFSVTGT